MAADLAAGSIAILVSYLVRPVATLHPMYLFGWRVHYAVLAGASLPVWLGCLVAAGAYRSRRPYEGLIGFRVPITTALQLLGVVAVGAFVFDIKVSREMVATYFPSLIVAVVLTRSAGRLVLTIAQRKGYGAIRMVLVGAPEPIRKFALHLSRQDPLGYEVAGVCTSTSGEFLGTGGGRFQVVGRPDDVVAAAKRLQVDTVAVVGQSQFSELTLQRVAWQLERSGIDLLVAPDVLELAGPRIRVTPLRGLPLLHITEPRIGGRGRYLKSFYDRLLAVVILLLASPIFAVVAVAIVADSGPPVFYRQERIGRGGRSFQMIKFRTMVPDAEQRLEALRAANEHDGVLFKIREDPRVTRFGRRLRKFSIDELPQLFNVISGDMDLVGPRPCLPAERESFGEAALRRFLVKPGMTGLWQVSGRADIPWEEAVLLDLYYVENWSPLMDLLILYRTLRVVLAGKGC